MLVFKKLDSAYRVAKTARDNYPSGSQSRNLEEEKIKAFLKIRDYIYSFAWMKRRDAIDKIKAVINKKFNYSEVAEVLGVTVESLQVTMSNASKAVEAKIGENTIKLISEGRLDEALLQYQVGVGEISLENHVLSDVLEVYPKSQNSLYTRIEECKEELDFLRLYSKSMMHERMGRLDADRLAFIRYILTNPDGRYVMYRRLLIEYMLGYIDYDYLVSEATHNSLY